MSTSMFAKLRKEAKAKTKQPRSKPEEVITKKEVEELVPVTEEELNLLLNTLNTPEPVLQTTEEQTVIPTVESKANNLAFEAIGLYYDQKKKKFMKVTIEYNPETEYSRILSSEEIADSKAVATYKVNMEFNLRLSKNTDVL